MPEVKKGQTKSEYISYCISWIKENEPDKKDWSTGRLYKHCEGLWNSAKSTSREKADAKTMEKLSAQFKNLGYKPIAFTSDNIGIVTFNDGTISMSEMTEEFESDGETVRYYDVVDAVVAVGDRFYGTLYVSSDVLRMSAHLWNSTYNDLSHFGTMYPAGMSSTENLEFITGYNSDAVFDDDINAVRVKMHISHNSPKYSVWKSFMDVTKDAKRIPNVSIFGFYKAKAMKKDKLPVGVVVPDGALHGNYVIAMSDIIPFAISTVLKGKCDDVAGCGISTGFASENDACIDGTCDTNISDNKPELPEDDENSNDKENEERINYLRERIKELKK